MNRIFLLALSLLLLSLCSQAEPLFCEGPAVLPQASCEIGFSSQDFHLLAEPMSAFNARFKALMGYELTQEQFLARDPEMALDFSQAPKLDTILISALVISNDFFGSLLFRALKYHAQQGAQVKIYVSEIFLHSREKVALAKLKAEGQGHVEIEVFNYKMKPKLSPHEWVNNIHRSMHVKVFLTFSESHPENNTLISGGRNLSDTYFYSTKPDYSKYPEMSQYGTYNYPFAYFDDLDFVTHDLEVVRGVMLQTEFLMHPDRKTRAFKKVGTDLQDIVLIPARSDARISFEISAPYLDHQALERNYVRLIDQAQHRIRILSPYLRFTKNIFAAFERARTRGVKIEIVTAGDYDGDVVPGILERSIEIFLRKIIQKDNVYLYHSDVPSEESQIMHAKAMLVDDQVLNLGSVNMNRRSFFHDIEIEYYLRGSQVVEEFNQLFEKRYLSHSQKMTEMPQKHKLIDPLIYLMGNII